NTFFESREGGAAWRMAAKCAFATASVAFGAAQATRGAPTTAALRRAIARGCGGAGFESRGLLENASVRISMRSPGRALGGEVGSSNAVWADQRARPSFAES